MSSFDVSGHVRTSTDATPVQTPGRALAAEVFRDKDIQSRNIGSVQSAAITKLEEVLAEPN